VLLLPGFSLSLPVTRLNIGSRLRKVASITPSHTAAYLLKVCVYAVNKDNRQCSTVTIQAGCVKFDLASEHEIAQVLLGTLAERLGFLRRIDSAQTHPAHFDWRLITRPFLGGLL
jgi:hypothetical protein